MSLACSYCGAPQPEGTAETNRCCVCGRPLTEPAFGDDPEGVFVDGPLQLDDQRARSWPGVDADGRPSSGRPPVRSQTGVPTETGSASPAMQPTEPSAPLPPPPAITEPDVGAANVVAAAYAKEQGAASEVSPLDEVTFPGEELTLYLAWRWLWLKRQPIAQRILLIAAAPVALFLLVSVPYCIGSSVAAPEEGSLPAVVYLQETHPLLSRPHLEPVEQSEGRLDRGAKLTRYDQIGDYLLVRDYLGRSGYVLTLSVGPEPPPSLPERYGFADCAPGYAEHGSEPCKARAQLAGGRCYDACPKAVAATCKPLCDQHLAACLAACDDPPPDKPACPACKKAPGTKAPAPSSKPKKKRKKKRK